MEQRAAELAEVLRQEVGAEGLAAALNAARSEVAAGKIARKRALALQASVDPEAAAQRKLKKNEKKAAERKLKRGRERVRREAGFVAKRRKRGGREE